MSFIPVALTWYPNCGRDEETFWVNMTHIPPVGASIPALRDDMPTQWVRFVSWVPEPWPGKDQGEPIPERWSLWHVEIGLSYSKVT